MLTTDPVPFLMKHTSTPATIESKANDNTGTGSFAFVATAGASIAKRVETNYTSPNAVAAKRVGNTLGCAT